MSPPTKPAPTRYAKMRAAFAVVLGILAAVSAFGFDQTYVTIGLFSAAVAAAPNSWTQGAAGETHSAGPT